MIENFNIGWRIFLLFSDKNATPALKLTKNILNEYWDK